MSTCWHAIRQVVQFPRNYSKVNHRWTNRPRSTTGCFPGPSPIQRPALASARSSRQLWFSGWLSPCLRKVFHGEYPSALRFSSIFSLLSSISRHTSCDRGTCLTGGPERGRARPPQSWRYHRLRREAHLLSTCFLMARRGSLLQEDGAFAEGLIAMERTVSGT